MNTEMGSSMTQGHTAYNPKKSSTYKEIGNGEFKISYGDSSWAHGGLASDTVSVGGATVQSQTFGLPTDVSESFTEDTYSNGLLGLGFSSINTFNPGPQKTFFDNIGPTLDEPVFTARLRSDGVGEYEFGTIDHSKYNGPLVNVSVDSSNGFWQFDTPAYGVQIDNRYRMWNSSGATAIADTGTSLILAEADVVQRYYQQIPGAVSSNQVGGYIYPCNADVPDLFFVISSVYKVIVPGSFMNFQQIGKNTTTNEDCEFSPSSKQSREPSTLTVVSRSVLWWSPVESGLQYADLWGCIPEGLFCGV